MNDKEINQGNIEMTLELLPDAIKKNYEGKSAAVAITHVETALMWLKSGK